MKFVEIYKTQNDGSQTVVATCELASEEVICKGDNAVVDNLKNYGISDYSDKPQQIFMKNGIGFLENLRFAFKSGYLNASEIKEK